MWDAGYAVDNILNILMASGATSTGFAIIGNFFYEGKVIFTNNPFNFFIGNPKTGTDNVSLQFSGYLRAPVVVFYGSFEGFAAHDGAVHFLFGQSAEIIGNIFIGHARCFFNGFSFDHFGERRGSGDGRAASEGLKIAH